MKSAKWYKSTFFVAGILPTITAIVATLITDYIKGISILTTFRNFVILIYNWVFDFINYEVKIYWIIFFIILLIIIYVIYMITLKNPTPKFLSYREAKPKNLKWTWDYRFNKATKNYQIVDLKSHCSSCDTPLRNVVDTWGSQVGADCPRCNKEYNGRQIDNMYSIRSIIEDDIRRMD